MSKKFLEYLQGIKNVETEKEFWDSVFSDFKIVANGLKRLWIVAYGREFYAIEMEVMWLQPEEIFWKIRTVEGDTVEEKIEKHLRDLCKKYIKMKIPKKEHFM